MGTGNKIGSGLALGLVLLMAVQGFCAAFFLNDVMGDIRRDGFGWALGLEVVANLTLIGAVGIEGLVLRALQGRQRRAEQALSAAQGALAEIVAARLDDWALTPSERDVALFTIKGCTIAEVASLRGSSEATVKSHLNAVYRKAGVSGRAQLVALFVEDLFAGAIEVPARQKPAHATAGPLG